VCVCVCVRACVRVRVRVCVCVLLFVCYVWCICGVFFLCYLCSLSRLRWLHRVLFLLSISLSSRAICLWLSCLRARLLADRPQARPYSTRSTAAGSTPSSSSTSSSLSLSSTSSALCQLLVLGSVDAVLSSAGAVVAAADNCPRCASQADPQQCRRNLRWCRLLKLRLPCTAPSPAAMAPPDPANTAPPAAPAQARPAMLGAPCSATHMLRPQRHDRQKHHRLQPVTACALWWSPPWTTIIFSYMLDS
jgi:hypothetical protein